jgi:hypothetical protein
MGVSCKRRPPSEDRNADGQNLPTHLQPTQRAGAALKVIDIILSLFMRVLSKKPAEKRRQCAANKTNQSMEQTINQNKKTNIRTQKAKSKKKL